MQSQGGCRHLFLWIRNRHSLNFEGYKTCSKLFKRQDCNLLKIRTTQNYMMFLLTLLGFHEVVDIVQRITRSFENLLVCRNPKTKDWSNNHDLRVPPQRLHHRLYTMWRPAGNDRLGSLHQLMLIRCSGPHEIHVWRGKRQNGPEKGLKYWMCGWEAIKSELARYRYIF